MGLMEGPFSPEAAVTKGKALGEYPGTAGQEHWCRSSVNPRRQGRWLRSCSLCWPEGCKGPGRKPGTAWKKPSDGKKMQGRDHGFIPALTAMLHHSRLQPSTLLSVHQTCSPVTCLTLAHFVAQKQTSLCSLLQCLFCRSRKEMLNKRQQPR